MTASLLDIIPKLATLGPNALTSEVIQGILAQLNMTGPMSGGIPAPGLGGPQGGGMGAISSRLRPAMEPTKMAMKQALEPIQAESLLSDTALKPSPLTEAAASEGTAISPTKLIERGLARIPGVTKSPPINVVPSSGGAPIQLGPEAKALARVGEQGLVPAAEGAADATAITGAAGAAGRGILSRLLGVATGPIGMAAMTALPGGSTLGHPGLADDSISGSGLTEEEWNALSPKAQAALHAGLAGQSGAMAGEKDDGQDSEPDSDADEKHKSGEYTIKKGDTISGLLMARMGKNVDPQTLSHLIGSIAKGNHLANPDQIVPGQHISFNVPYNEKASYHYSGPRGAGTQNKETQTQSIPSSGPKLEMGAPVSSKLSLGVPQLQHLTRLPLTPKPDGEEDNFDYGQEPIGQISRRINKRYRP